MSGRPPPGDERGQQVTKNYPDHVREGWGRDADEGS